MIQWQTLCQVSCFLIWTLPRCYPLTGILQLLSHKLSNLSILSNCSSVFPASVYRIPHKLFVLLIWFLLWSLYSESRPKSFLSVTQRRVLGRTKTWVHLIYTRFRPTQYPFRTREESNQPKSSLPWKHEPVLHPRLFYLHRKFIIFTSH